MAIARESELYKLLPSVDELLRRPDIASLVTTEGHLAVADAARAVLLRVRQEISDGHLNSRGLEIALIDLGGAVKRVLDESLAFSLKTVINATGVILHTNLGRAPLAEGAIEHIKETALGYSNLEFDLVTGERGQRDVHTDRLFAKLFAANAGSGGGAVSTIVVNNNAAAVLLALNTLAEDGEVIVSRGELVEIGGSFRIPDVMGKSHATLVEVGTTNRTRAEDYERAINEKTRLILRVHRSNFEITGFTEQPALDELSALARTRKIPLMEDLGSGALFDLRTVGVASESSVFDSIRAGVDVVSYSGDKLLGGPQAGILSGRVDLIAKMRSNSLFRALRVDKLTYAALETTLLAYVKGKHGTIPAARMMQLTKSEIGERAERLAQKIGTRFQVEVVDGESLIGGGAAPSSTLPTRILAVSHEEYSADELAVRLRKSHPPVIARIAEGRVLLDLRTVLPDQDDEVYKAIVNLLT
jgi:L-seryl-tRNA(Ser) seleniumtransferase